MNVSLDLILAQIMLRLNAGVFYVVLTLGLAIIFGLLNIINFDHGALYMLGAFVALIGYSYSGPWLGFNNFHLGFWPALSVAPILVCCFGMLVQRTMLRRLYQFDHMYALLLTCGFALIFQRFSPTISTLLAPLARDTHGHRQARLHVFPQVPSVRHRVVDFDLPCHLARH